jgi:predicted nucleotide-binding protein
MHMASKNRGAKGAPIPPPPATRVTQEAVPSATLEEALRIPRAISENYGGRAASPLHVASAAGISPTSSTFRVLCGAALGYGLTTGSYSASEIGMTELSRRITRPLAEGDELPALREALLKPRVVREFLTRYDGSKLPPANIAANVLGQLGVPDDRTGRAFAIITEGARQAGVLHEIKGVAFVSLQGEPTNGNVSKPAAKTVSAPADDEGDEADERSAPRAGDSAAIPTVAKRAESPAAPNRRVFVTHGKNRSLLELLKNLLKFGELEAVISAERESVSLPVPDKVMNDMRSCAAAVIHVDDEQTLLDPTGEQVVVLNPNVLIEIGAAMALYGRRFILLVKDGTRLPSNLQGLYEVRYKGASLDGDTTVKLLSAINDIKNHDVPVVRTSAV